MIVYRQGWAVFQIQVSKTRILNTEIILHTLVNVAAYLYIFDLTKNFTEGNRRRIIQHITDSPGK